MLNKKIASIILAGCFFVTGTRFNVNASTYENYWDTPLGYGLDTDSRLNYADSSFPLSVPKKI